MSHKIHIVADAEVMSRAAAEIIVAHMSASLPAREAYSIVLSGGSTPRRLYTLLAGDAGLRERIPWSRVHFFWGDERHVAPDHPDSNYHMAAEAMLSRVPVPPANIHRMRGEDPDAARAAADYAKEIRRFFNITGAERPRFNFVLLGMGPDGHTASLFPGTPALSERRRLVMANWIDQLQAHRITLTAPVFNNADRILFLVGGRSKADTLKAVLEGERSPDRYPAQLIRAQHGRLLWLLDRAASVHLDVDRHARSSNKISTGGRRPAIGKDP